MIKKITIATFNDGGYAGQYDWQGGIPLSIGETINITLNGAKLVYKLINKTTDLEIKDSEQLVTTRYWFETASKRKL
jgi:hypothetical protein